MAAREAGARAEPAAGVALAWETATDGTLPAVDPRLERRRVLDRTLTQLRERWGQGSIVRLDAPDALSTPAAAAIRPEPFGSAQDRPVEAPRPRLRPRRERPAWWPVVLPDGSVMRPSVLELAAPPGSGRLTLALSWLAAAAPTLAAIVDPDHTFYPPAATAAGLPLDRLLLVRPPLSRTEVLPLTAHSQPGQGGLSVLSPQSSVLALDAVALLLRSEAFDAILCPLPAGARISTVFAGKLATLAARAGTALLLLTQPRYQSTQKPTSRTPPKEFVTPFTAIAGGRDSTAPNFGTSVGTATLPSPARRGEQPSTCAASAQGVRGWSGRAGGEVSPTFTLLGPFSDYRVRLTTTRWLWEHGRITGLKLQLVTERARGEDVDGQLPHQLVLSAPPTSLV